MESQISLSLNPLSKFPITIFLRTIAGIIQNLWRNEKEYLKHNHIFIYSPLPQPLIQFYGYLNKQEF